MKAVISTSATPSTSGIELAIEIDQASPIPLYHQIYRELKAIIDDGQLPPGALLPSNRDLSTQLGLDHKTIHRALDELAREGYVDRQRGRGTFVRPRTPKCLIGVHVPHRFAFATAAYPEYLATVVTHFCEQLAEREIGVEFYGGCPLTRPVVPSIDDRLYKDLQSGALQGLAIWSPINFPRSAFEVARRRRVPVLSFKNTRHLPIDLFSYGDIEGFIANAARSFIAAGRTRIAVIHSVGDMDLPDRKSLARRIEELGGQCKSEHVVMRECTRNGGYGAAAALPLQQLDALIIADDYMTSGVERYLIEHDIRVPEAMQIASLVNPVSGITFSLPMTRYQFDFKRVNIEGIELLTKAIDGKVTDRQQHLTPLERID